MKKLMMFLLGLLLICLTAAMLFIGAAIYDTASQQTVDTFFFQPANLSSERIETPVALEELDNETVRNMLVDKFITEYFYVIPDVQNATERVNGDTGLRILVDAAAFAKWKNTEAPLILELAEKSVLRLARVIDIELPEFSDGWWTLTYELTTWEKPNNLFVSPTVTQGTMNIKMRYEPGFWKKSNGIAEMDIAAHLEAHKDPSLIFKFRVYDIDLVD